VDIKQTRQLHLSSLILSSLLLTACGGGESTKTNTDGGNTPPPTSTPTAKQIEQKAINKIAQYAEDGKKAPTLIDYKQAGISGATSTNLAKINLALRKVASKLKANTKQKIQVIVSKALAPVVADPVILINEVLASNVYTNLDTDFYAHSDWIELYNPSSKTVDISGYSLSDDKTNLKQWLIPTGTSIKANDYLVIWADKRNTQAKALHADFSLSAKGETLTLKGKTGTVLDTFKFANQDSDISSAKVNNKTVFMQPTPGKKNTLTLASNERSKAPVFSSPSSFNNTSLSLMLSLDAAASTDTAIYYTLDGSLPTKQSTLYQQAITLDKTSVVRAITVAKGKFSSKPVSHTYFIGHTTTLPVISLITDDKNLNDDTIGIYTDGTNGIPLKQCDVTETTPFNYANEWYRPVDIEYLNPTTGASEFSLNADLGISGQCSRRYEKKSFEVELDSKYGTKSLTYKLYNDKDLSSIKDFKLRTGNEEFEIADILSASIVSSGQLNIDYQAYQTVQMFMNGEYWGVYNIREKKGGDYLKSNYPTISKKKVDIIKNADLVKRGDRKDYDNLRDYLRNLDLKLTDATHYQYVIDRVDENSFIDYVSFMIYNGNFDWVYSNQRTWKEKKTGAKWRWILDDIDYGFRAFKDDGTTSNLATNNFTALINNPSGTLLTQLFQSLMTNPTFKQKFKTRFNQLLAVNGVLSPVAINLLVDKINNERKDFIFEGKFATSQVAYAKHIQDVKSFVTARSAIVKAQLAVFIP
jgi:hypothetical protein